ncbi:cilia- and flagella-associated protein 119-like [Paramacrobiotus metropolitanus]|uniref:cilia- and flagella-associated protein 119-like n=1 Tax=Paramacrobiotus metropolitanus TaxID=2943436 RepID=UPI002445B64F|nr:cilia- and flagella-associated protein 119-like [Paramacrobiotus metropolitanus]
MPPKEKHAAKPKDGHTDKTADNPIAVLTEQNAANASPASVRSSAADEHITPEVSQNEVFETVKTKLDTLIEEIKATEIRRPLRSTRVPVVHGLEPFYKPCEREPGLVVWKHLPFPAVEKLHAASNVKEIRSVLGEHFALLDDDAHPQDAIVLDLYCQVIRYATQKKFDFAQTSSIFGIVQEMHEKTLETPVDNLVECLEYMDNLFCLHVIKRPPWSARIFSEEQAKDARQFVIRNYIRYFHMYKHVFTPTVIMDLSIDYQRREEPRFPPEEFEALSFDKITMMNPVTNAPMTLQEVLQDIDMENQVPTAVAPVSKAAPNDVEKVERVDDKVSPTTEDAATKSPHLAELEKVIAAQVDVELKHLRERLGSQLQKVDEILIKTLGADAVGTALANDPFAYREPAPPEPEAKKGKKKTK